MNVTTIKKNDVLFITVPVGNLPSQRAKDHMESVRLKFKKYFDNDIMVTGSTFAAGSAYTIEVLRKE
jgi:hypothetical protein